MLNRKRNPRCIIIAGPNGAGKTTFARRYLPEDAGMVHFVNADLIAGGLSPLKPQLAAIAAARMVLREIDRLAAERSRSWKNFERIYKALADSWAVYDNSGRTPRLLERSP